MKVTHWGLSRLAAQKRHFRDNKTQSLCFVITSPYKAQDTRRTSQTTVKCPCALTVPIAHPCYLLVSNLTPRTIVWLFNPIRKSARGPEHMAMWIFDHALKKTLDEGLFFSSDNYNIFVSKYNLGNRLHYYMMTIIISSLH